MKTENYFELQNALLSFYANVDACTEENEKWTDAIDKDVVSSIKYLLNVLSHILDDEKTPEIIKTMECDLVK